MILKTSIDSKSKFFQIQEVCGESFNLIEKFSYGVFGSLRYRIKNIFTKTTLSEISNYKSIVYANFYFSYGFVSNCWNPFGHYP